ncbi:MAG TPA: histidine--tRNA ligase [Candidatus Paceibacterota bacterium]|nr:histidine--tRNA ligase [Candidatus Paceibacterota bacterium]HMO83185.1 histidine--tRNA ligase [Candidatus Paceibacterota bacterium]
MTKTKLSTDSYKGVRDFYPQDMAVQNYIFETWTKTARSFGFEHYDASVLEPAELYKAKGAENAEMVNEQTYTFLDRGDREVTLRPEMTPTVARMVAGKRRELHFPLRWFSIPNLFRYERPQRGRLREHWQLNCDIFGADDYTADVEVIALAYQLLIDFGATPDMFEILVNNRQEMTELYNQMGISDTETINKLTQLNDRKNKISAEQYTEALLEILSNPDLVQQVTALIENPDGENEVTRGLAALGITNVRIDRSIARGFNYYTGTIFEIVDRHEENNRSMLGGGRYDNLTQMFSDEPISGIGFGMGDVTMKDFLISHNLLPETVKITAAKILIIPTETDYNLEAQKLAQQIRARGLTVATASGTKKLGKKIADAAHDGVTYIIVIGPDEIAQDKFTLKNLPQNTEETGTLEELLTLILSH